MRTRKLLSVAAVLAVGVALTGCGKSGSSSTTSAGQGCQSASGSDLVVLTDDKKLQTVDNIIPAINAGKASPTLTGALDKVGAALSTDKLVALNKSTDIDRKTPKTAAEAFVKAESLD
ncbi:MAG: glycine/betaine ABC transporter substrate-binding protein, partial [Pseudonocardiales bacterium]